jgi:DNA modification methylase
MKTNQILFGDCRNSLGLMSAKGIKVQTCVTSPPYFGLRDYGVEGQIGLEPTADEYISELVKVFRCVRDVLADDGTLWLNMGDSYGAGKQLLGIPWRVALLLQADGWVLRQDIIWNKSNPMPESVTDRCTKAHEYIFLLSKSAKYYYNQEAIREPHTGEAAKAVEMGTKVVGQRGINPSARRGLTEGQETQFKKQGHSGYFGADGKCLLNPNGKNKRSVWNVATKGYKGAHFATFPPKLIEPCILAGSRPGDIVLDPFMGSGTTAAVAIQHGRQYFGCELNEDYRLLQDARICGAIASAAQLSFPLEAA